MKKNRAGEWLKNDKRLLIIEKCGWDPREVRKRILSGASKAEGELEVRRRGDCGCTEGIRRSMWLSAGLGRERAQKWVWLPFFLCRCKK